MRRKLERLYVYRFTVARYDRSDTNSTVIVALLLYRELRKSEEERKINIFIKHGIMNEMDYVKDA